jgi:hypothetical protein
MTHAGDEASRNIRQAPLMILKHLAYTLLSATLLAAPAYADATSTQQEDPLFDKLDTDLDGFISRAESSKDQRVAERFERLDLNQDDRLDKVEFEVLNTIDKTTKPNP